MKIPPARCLLIIVLLAVTGHSQPASAGSEERQARARQATEQRLAHAASAQYKPYDSEKGDLRKEVAEFLNKKKYAEAIVVAEKALARYPCDIDFRFLLAIACRSSGNVAKADQYRAEWMALVDSILSSGDGREPASAYQVISVDEEYSVVGILGLQVVSQKLTQEGESEFDVMTVKKPGADEVIVLYFNVDLPKRWLNKEFGSPGKK